MAPECGVMGRVWHLNGALWEGCGSGTGCCGKGVAPELGVVGRVWHRNYVLWEGCGTVTGCCGKGVAPELGVVGRVWHRNWVLWKRRGTGKDREIFDSGYCRCRDGSFDMVFMRQLTSVKKINAKDRLTC